MLDTAVLSWIAKAILGQAVGQGTRAVSGRALRLLRGDPIQRATAAALGDALVELEREHSEAVAAWFDEVFLKSAEAVAVLASCLAPGVLPRSDDLAEAWMAHTAGTSRDRHAREVIVGASECLLAAFDRALDKPERQHALGELRAYRANRLTADATSEFAFWVGSQRRRGLIDPTQRYTELDLERFAGRAWLVDHVDAFLRGCDGGYLEIEGSAGVGKSTFLAWLARERGYPIHFVRLVRGRDDTAAALTNLSLQLADVWEVEGPVSLHGPDVEPHEFYELLCAITRTREQRGRRDPVVIVIDGLDEVRTTDARGNVLGLPPRPPDGVYVIVSRRPVHVELTVDARWPPCRLRTDDERHLSDLRNYLSVACTRPTIASALRSVEGTAQSLIDALTDKSAGVWLYVHHILNEIERGTRDIRNLDDLPVGLWAFYAQHVRARARDADCWERYEFQILSTLAAAQEPLDQTVLTTLAGVENGPAIDEVIDAWAAFLEREGVPPYRLYHDSLRRFLAGEASEETLSSSSEARMAVRLGAAMRGAHGRIVERYLGLWGSLTEGLPGLRDVGLAGADDGYGIRQLGAHLAACGRYDDLRALLRAEWPDTPRARSAWYEAHAQAGDHVRYLTDVAHATRLAQSMTDRALAAGQSASTLGDEFGYALLAGSIRAHSGNIPAELRRALVGQGIWTPARALADARMITSPKARAQALAALAEHLDTGQLDEPLNALRASDERALSGVLSVVAEYLDSDQLSDALGAASQISDEYVRAGALRALAQYLDTAQAGEARDIASRIGVDIARVDVLVALAPRLDNEESRRVVGEALDAARRLGDQELARVLEAAAEHLDSGQTRGALDVARQIGDPHARVRALGSLAGILGGDERRRVLREALDAARQISDEHTRARALASLTAVLDSPQLSEVRDAALGITNESARATVLRALTLASCAHSDGRPLILSEVLHRASEIRDPRARADALAKLAVNVHGDDRRRVLDEALDAARHIGDDTARARELASLAAHIDSEQVPRVLGEALVAARKIRVMRDRAHVLASLATRLHGDEFRQALGEALDTARQIGDETARAHVVGALASHLDGELRLHALGETLAFARQITSASELVGLLSALAEHLDRPQLCEALEIARQMDDGYRRTEALGSLAARLSGDNRRRVLHEALSSATQIPSEDERFLALDGLAAHLEGAQHGAILDAVSRMTGDWERGFLLRTLAQSLHGEAVGQALDAARQIGDHAERVAVLVALAPGLNDHRSVVGEALMATRLVHDEDERARALETLAAHLDSAQLADACAAAREIANEIVRARALGSLAAHLGHAQLAGALDVARQMTSPPAQALALGALVPRLIGDEHRLVLAETVEVTSTICDADTRAYLLQALAERLDGDERRMVLHAALHAARQITDAIERALKLASLAAHLDRSECRLVLNEALDAARQITDAIERALKLASLATHLDGSERRLVMNEALDAARQITDGSARCEALRALACDATIEHGGSEPTFQVEVWREALGTATRIGRPSVLGVVSWSHTRFPALEGSDGVVAVLEWLRCTARWWP